MHDVAIVGASLAGAATAIHLSRLGRKVILLDRATFPRRKACGEGLFPAGVRELEKLGVLERLEGRAAPLERLRFHAGRYVAEAPLHGIGVARDQLDAALLSVVKDEGIDLRTNVYVRGMVGRDRRVEALDTHAGAVHARAFVAADGLHSRLRRLARLDVALPGSRYGVSAHLALPEPPEPAVDVTFAQDHELYLTPTGGNAANVAMLLHRREMWRFAGNLRQGYLDTLARYPAFEGAQLVDEPKVAGPFPRTCKRAWRANLALAGDAAGFYDGISGEGMSAALTSARACATAIDTYLRTGSYAPFRAYDRQRRALVRNSDLLARLSVTLASRGWSARLAVRNLQRCPETFAKLVAINTGDASLRQVRLRDLSALIGGV